MREASIGRTVTDTDSYAFSFYRPNAKERKTEAEEKDMNISLSQCREIIDIFNQRNDREYDFDSHEFIRALRICFPQAYYTSLLEYESNVTREEAFQRLHAKIGRFLSENGDQLKINKLGKHNSPNYKQDPSSNERWKKL